MVWDDRSTRMSTAAKAAPGSDADAEHHRERERSKLRIPGPLWPEDRKSDDRSFEDVPQGPLSKQALRSVGPQSAPAMRQLRTHRVERTCRPAWILRKAWMPIDVVDLRTFYAAPLGPHRASLHRPRHPGLVAQYQRHGGCGPRLCDALPRAVPRSSRARAGLHAGRTRHRALAARRHLLDRAGRGHRPAAAGRVDRPAAARPHAGADRTSRAMCWPKCGAC